MMQPYAPARQIDSAAPLRFSTPLSAIIPRVSVRIPGREIVVGGGAVAFPPLTPAASTSHAMTLTNVFQALPYRYMTAPPVVKRTSDNVTLLRDIDYWFDADRGMISGVPAIDGNYPPTPIAVTFSGIAYRFDSVWLNVSTNAIEVTTGTAHALIPEEYAAVAPLLGVELYRARVWPGGIELLPTHKSAGRSYIADEFLGWLRTQWRNRRATRKIRAKIAAGQAVRIALYGDSIAAIGQTSISPVNQNIAPNGPYRDIPSYLVRWPTADLNNAVILPRFDGAAGVGQHIHINIAYPTVDALRAAGATVNFDNWGIGGSNTNNSSYVAGGETFYNGSHPTRLNALIASAPDLVILAFGRNEAGSDLTRANTNNIVAQLKAAGIEVIVVAPTRNGEFYFSENLEKYYYTCEELRGAADYQDVGFFPTHEYMGDGRAEAFGMAAADMAAADLLNHPGPMALGLVGRALADTFV